MTRLDAGRIPVVVLGAGCWDVDARRSILGRRAVCQRRGQCREHISTEKPSLNLLIWRQDSQVDRSGCIRGERNCTGYKPAVVPPAGL